MDFLEKFNIKIRNKELLQTALTHSSYANEHNVSDYERLEYLGDAVLELIMSEYFYLNTSLEEGEMSKIRASYVCETALAEYSKKIGLVPFVRVGEGQKNDINDTIIADMFESVLGTIYLDLGINECKKLVKQIVLPYIKKEYKFFDDYKSVLQELTQTSKNTLEYVVVSESGPSHDKTFKVEVRIDNMVYGVGYGKSKKEAEQNAAASAYKKRAQSK